ncbi:hypothetical protein Bca52824_029799 [Brassica carinata]|uniref:Uncharacterized protein n=1 Tax=Brassica carinata TaxID=52824 RepID=A0A8X7S536_BRACI|nr:hypothetical protein Bca52824_029799 [Brassica carinata]
MNNENEQETLSSGALCFIGEPIKPNDLNTIQKDIDHTINDGSKKIEDDTDGSNKIEKTTSSSDPCDEDSSSQATQKFKIKWTGALENQFHKAIQHIGGVHKATPKKLLKFMNLKLLTRAHVASKLQKYRQNLKRDREQNMNLARIAMNYPQHRYNYNTRLGNINPCIVQPGYGLGQSSSMMNNNAGLHDSVNYMNRRPTYDLRQTRSKLFPRRGNLGFQNGMSPQKEEWRSIPGTSQAPRFGQYGTTSNVLGMNYNPTAGSGSLHEMSVHGNGHGSLGGIRGHGSGNGSLEGIRVHGNSNDSLGGIRVHGTNTGSLGGIRVHGTNTGSVGGIRVHGTGAGSIGGTNVPTTGNGNGSLGGIRVHGNSNDSLGGIRVHGNSNGSLHEMSVHGNGHGSLGGIRGHGSGNGSLEGIRVHGNSNDSLGGIRVHGTNTGSVGGIRVHGTNTGSVGGIRVHGTGAGSIGGTNVPTTGNGNGSLGGIRVHGTGSGSLHEMSVHGNGHGSLGGIRGHGSGNGSLEGIRVHGTSNGNGSLGGIRVHGNSNDSLGGIRVHGTSNGNGSLGGIRGHGSGNGSLEGIRVHGNIHGTGAGSIGGTNVPTTGNGNGSLGENFGTNWNFSNNNKSNHGSSTSVVPSVLSSFLENKDQSQNNLIAQTGGEIPALENSKIFNDHHDINEIFPDTNNSQIHHQNQQHQGNLTGVNLEAPTAYPLEDVNSWSFNDGTNNEEMLNSLAANPEMYFPTQDMNITNQDNNHEEILYSLATNPEMYFPTQDMNITNQASIVSIAERFFLTLDYFHDCDGDEDFLNFLIDPDMD